MKRDPVVLNRAGPLPIDMREARYIGRGSPWGNPFVIGKDGTRDEVCNKFEALALFNYKLLARARKELRGRDLICFCKPLRCHGDFWLKVANGCDCGFEDGGHEPDCYEVIK